MSLTFSSTDIPTALKRKRILMVTNTPSLRALHASFLRSQGFDYVFEAGDGLQAIDMLRVQPIDLILSDWQLEELSGLDLLHTVRGSVAIADIPFIMLTTKKDMPRVRSAIDLGATDYLIKPFKTAQLGMKLVMALATSNYVAPKVIREELRIRSILEHPVLTDQVSLLKRA
jgi:two-component system chemotaxis response regulator CheY